MHHSRSCIVATTILVIMGTANNPAGGDSGGGAQNSEVLARTSNVTISRVGPWINYQYTSSLLGVQRRTYEGRRDGAGGCIYSGEETVLPGAGTGITEEREIASSTEDCIMVTETGRRPSTPEQSAAGMRTEVARVSTATSPSQPEDVTPAATTRSARHKTYYEDPPGLDVNSAETNVTWTYSGGCVTSSRDHYAYYGWLAGSGWRKDSSRESAARFCEYARTTSHSYFFNGAFCVGIDTRTQYAPNEIKGQSNGTYYMKWSASKSGGCTSLLSFHRTHGYK